MNKIDFIDDIDQIRSLLLEAEIQKDSFLRKEFLTNPNGTKTAALAALRIRSLSKELEGWVSDSIRNDEGDME